MARPHVLLCGIDNGRRFEQFRAAGFSVDQFETEFDVVRWLLSGKSTDLICVLEAEHRAVEETTMALVKNYTEVPLVLFRASHRFNRNGLWSLEVLPMTPAGDWLRGIQDLTGLRRSAGYPSPVM